MSDDDFIAEFDDACPDGRGVTIDDFVALAPGNSFIFKPTGEAWVAQAVRSAVAYAGDREERQSRAQKR